MAHFTTLQQKIQSTEATNLEANNNYTVSKNFLNNQIGKHIFDKIIFQREAVYTDNGFNPQSALFKILINKQHNEIP